MKLHTRVAPLVALALLAAALAGGEATKDPKGLLRQALAGLGEGPGLTVTASLDTDMASLRAAAAEAPQPVPDALLQLLADAALRVSVPLGDASAGTAALELEAGGEELLALRGVGQGVYLRADVRRLMAAAGQDPAALDGLAAMLASAGIPAAALDGAWLRLAEATAMAEEITGLPIQGEAGASPAALRARVERLAGILADASEVEHVGADANGEQVRATVPLRAVYDAVLASADELGLPPASSELPSRDEVPDTSVFVDAWVRDGRLTAASVDLRQFADLRSETPLPAGVERLGLHLAFAEFDGRVEAPADAVELDVRAVFGALLGGMMPN
jgi:hypothetical protein